MTSENITKGEIDIYHELLLDQTILLDFGGRPHFDIRDLEFIEEIDYADIAGEMEFELASILRKRYAKKYPKLRKVARDIAIKARFNQENSEDQ
jgi:hypothetical protein